MPNWKNLILILCTLCTNSNCRKKDVPDAKRFEEDPTTTKTSVEDRLAGTWIVGDLTFKGNSVFDQLNKTSAVNPILDNISLFYDKGNKDHNIEAFFSLKPAGFAGWSKIDTMSFSCHKTDTSISYSLLTPFNKNDGKNGKAYLKSDWRVTKLFNTELNMTRQTDSGQYKIFWKLRSR